MIKYKNSDLGICTSTLGLPEYFLSCDLTLPVVYHYSSFFIDLVDISETGAQTKAYLHLCNYVSYIKRDEPFLSVPSFFSIKTIHTCVQIFIAYPHNHVVLLTVHVFGPFISSCVKSFYTNKDKSQGDLNIKALKLFHIPIYLMSEPCTAHNIYTYYSNLYDIFFICQHPDCVH